MKRNSAVLLTTHSIFYAAADLGAWAQRLAAFERSELIPRAMIQAGMQPDRVTAWEQRFDNLARLREQLAVLRDNTKALADAGLLVIAGSDTSNSGTGTFLGLCSQVELDLLAEAGIPPDQIVQMASLNAARMMAGMRRWARSKPASWPTWSSSTRIRLQTSRMFVVSTR